MKFVLDHCSIQNKRNGNEQTQLASFVYATHFLCKILRAKNIEVTTLLAGLSLASTNIPRINILLRSFPTITQINPSSKTP